MKTSRKSSYAQVETDIVCARIRQRAETWRSNSGVILKHQADGRLHGHGDGELAGAGLRAGAGGKKAEQSAEYKQRFLSVETESVAHRIKASPDSVSCFVSSFAGRAQSSLSANVLI